ncbi:VCBS repeat-containing protein [Glycomyces sp. TRM65418]|uniref:FG-GAP repeat domain-containing protein n=1 Tax=Glycomyces sp. TRM65418 TaxID=2867006 RepID=UPI001CE70655|nr:VCBS repeat-containing protein [Glycomyces sp. TRM65418]MCC3764635.1 VCBS repeat-containing protein [Glycomyces sp. TRM65418]QZD54298.1 VCBS repeat-containing protein [Glycomyces sp. TRM65418]
MKQAPPERLRRRGRGRAATATAAVLGATLVACPGGTATAQTDIDCDALGEDPLASTLATAFASAAACGFEVRIGNRSEPYSTLFVTPTGQLHLEATADPTGSIGDDGTVVDPTLMDFQGSLAQTESPWPFWLYHTDTTQPLFYASGGALEWTGEKPAAAYADTTAVYDELAEGLDLSVEVDAASAELRFSVDSAEAWHALATGLILEESYEAVVENDTLRMYSGPAPDNEEVRTTPFAALDAAGAFNAVGLQLDGDALTLSLSESVLDTAAFPLTVTTQWAYSGYGIGEWGVVSSAAPDLAAYRGIGAGTSLLEHSGGNGDAGVGPYCDAFAAGTDCATPANAASYWNFYSSLKTNHLRKPDTNYQWSFPIDQATFSIDLAPDENGMFTCRTPDLVPVADYGTTVTWSEQPAATGDPVAARCEDEVVTYDVTEPVNTAWADATVSSEVAFGMLESADTARFHGGSARLDVYFDIVGLIANTLCSTFPADPAATPFTADRAIYARGWGADVIDLDLSWTAVVRDYETGETALTTDPAPVPVEGGRVGAIPEGLPDGRYAVEYQLVSGVNGFTHTARPCYFVVDTVSPEFVDVTGDAGPLYVGDKATIEITVADAGFPDGVNELRIDCHYQDTCGGGWPRTLEADTAFSFEIPLTEGGNLVDLTLSDRAGNEDHLQLDLRASHDRNDFDGDGYQDLVAARESDGRLLLYPGNGDGTFGTPVPLATGWNKMDVVMAGDLTSDGDPDLLARDTATGTMYTYPGNGDGAFGSRIRVGGGWNGMSLFTSGDDYDSVGAAGGSPDLLAVRKSDGKLFYYPGLGDGTFGAATAIGTGWNSMDSLTSVGDLGFDSQNQLLARDSRTGTYYVYTDYGDRTFEHRTALPKTSDGIPITDRVYTEIAAAGDQDGDGYIDLVAVDSRTGELVLNPLTGVRNPAADEAAVSTGWGAIHLPTSDSDRTYDYNGDGKTDVFARRGSDGKLYFYSGNGSGGFGPIGTWGTGLKTMSVIETAGDLNGDGFADLIGRVASNGELYLYPGNGQGGHSAPIRIGTGWNAMSAIVSGHDFNGDGTVDVLAREKSTGYLWLYAGRGNGAIGSRVRIGTGWNSMREITAAGDLNHDGHADVIAIRSSDNCMYFYAGRGNGTLTPAVQISCHWVGYDSVAAVGDFNGDGHADWLARRQSDGSLYLYKGNGAGDFGARTQIQTGWSWANAIA